MSDFYFIAEMKLSLFCEAAYGLDFSFFGYRVMKFGPSRYPSKCWNVNWMPCSVNNESCFYPDSQQTDMACWRTGFTFQYRTAFALHTGNTRNRAAHENKAHLSCALFYCCILQWKSWSTTLLTAFTPLLQSRGNYFVTSGHARTPPCSSVYSCHFLRTP